MLITAPFVEADVVTQPLFDEPFVLLLPADHRLASKAQIQPSDLVPSELLLLGEGDCHARADPRGLSAAGSAQESGAGVRTFTQGATLETLRHMVASRLGVTILPQTAAEAPLYAPNLLVTRPFANPVPKRSLALAWRVSFPRHKAIDLLRRAIQASSSAYWNYNTARSQEAPGVMVENRNW